MKITTRDVWWACGILGMSIVLACSFYSWFAATLGNKITDDAINGAIQMIDTKTGKTLNLEFSQDTKNTWNTYYPIIASMRDIAFYGACILVIYIIVFTKFQKPSNPFKKKKEFGT